MDHYEKIVFKLTQDEDGYPGVSFESVWGVQVGPNQYKVDNVPVYVYGVSKGDVVKIEQVDGESVVTDLLYRSGHYTLRVFVEDQDLKAQVVKDITARGGRCSVSSAFSLFSVDLPPEVDFQAVDSYLNALADGDTFA
ncbi:DUF4265 domain-containing protein [Pseudomonas sp. NPDC089401]|uniref:DUF4265 domain-containing protein n=1 Tax=Pseudomonas sp. NPDC089401 TaxID=3364462 RepID=UPI0037FCEC2D